MSATAGPWEISGGDIWAISPWNARVRIASITTFSPMNGIDSEANAKLIAAAPDLVAALKEARSMLAVVGLDEADDDYQRSWDKGIATVDAALAKAGAQ